jgi:Holliday junction resolvase
VNAKAKGSRNERRSRKMLETAGYSVTRAAASLGAWDLVGISSVDVVLVQVKTRDWPPAAEIDFLRRFQVPTNVRKFLHRWRHGERLPDVREIGP